MSGYPVRRAGPSVTDCIAAAMHADPNLTLEMAIVTVPICQETIDRPADPTPSTSPAGS